MREPQSDILLRWYDANARSMPWRVSPADRQAGIIPNPYHVWLSEVMLQQTTVAAVKKYFLEFQRRWPCIDDLAAADDADVMGAWAGLGYYARARNLLKCARYVSRELSGRFPETCEELLRLPGIGPYTAAAISAIAFDQQAAVVDGNVERVMARFHAVTDPLPGSKAQLKAQASSLTPSHRPGDYAQAVMDLGATICTPRNPSCGVCPWMNGCKGRAKGIAATLPAKTPKAPKPVRYGVIYVVRRPNGDWLLEQRPPNGLLGGMLGFPGTPWAEEQTPENAPVTAEWAELGAQVRHTFTHFHLVLSVRVARFSRQSEPNAGHFVPAREFRPQDLPTVMRKVYDLAVTWEGWNCP